MSKKENKYFYKMSGSLINGGSLALLAIMIILTFLIFKLTNFRFELDSIDYAWSYIFLIPYFIFHEILHSIGYVVNGADFKRITYGAHIEKGILCCSCKQEVNKKCIMWSLMYPFLFIGILTYILGIIFNNITLVILSILNISGCAGDLAMFFAFLKIKDFRFFEYDNPLAFGIVTSEDLSNRKFLGLVQYEENNFKQTVDKKVTVSKTSTVLFVVYIVAALLYLFID